VVAEWIGGLAIVAVLVVAFCWWVVVSVGMMDIGVEACDGTVDDLDMPTWSDGDELRADEDYDRALREWQQSVELPSHPRPKLSVVGVARLRRDLSKPVKLTQAEAEQVLDVLFPRRRKAVQS
jgi:hypothetical protein